MFARGVRNDASFFHWHIHVATDALYLQLPNLWPECDRGMCKLMLTNLQLTRLQRVAMGMKQCVGLCRTTAGNTLENYRNGRTWKKRTGQDAETLPDNQGSVDLISGCMVLSYPSASNPRSPAHEDGAKETKKCKDIPHHIVYIISHQHDSISDTCNMM